MALCPPSMRRMFGIYAMHCQGILAWYVTTHVHFLSILFEKVLILFVIFNLLCPVSCVLIFSLDGYMNIAMEQAEEYVDGQLKAKHGDCFIRGNNGERL